MTVKTQGTDLFGLDPRDNSIIVVGCVTTIDGIDSSVEQIETTCLNSGKDRKYVSGMGSPGAASFGINIDPSDASHLKLYQLKQLGLTLKWAIGWGDGPMEPDGTIDLPPTVVNDDFDLPDGRSWLLFEGYMSSFPFSFNLNDVVKSAVGIQISGTQVLIPKASGTGPRPRWFVGPANAHTSGTQAFLDAATLFGSPGSKIGTIENLQTTTGNYGWVAMPGDVSAVGVTFRDDTNTPGDWNGAGEAGPNTDGGPSPAQSAVTFADGDGFVWRLFRMDYPHSQPTAGDWTTS
ncbi:phage tail tube protein [Pseudorhodoferax soli]|uniref:Phage tail tube protein n=1 Tax=Pseudorhodoferax soli TaxID=545864 RepID=A0A368Y259_9BURK|nr:phage tail tube protein [Pseudorhodoferax soli]RCW73809.1 phage tail tube protein [Pseudorhodoferax soli]